MKKFYILLLSISIVFLWSSKGFSTELNQKIEGTATMASGDTDITVTLPLSVDMTRSILLFTLRVDDPDVGQVLVGGELSGINTVEFHRDATGPIVSISYQVLEFTSGITVQRGSAITVGTSTSIGISAVDLNKSFATVSIRNSGSQFGTDDAVAADLTTATNLNLLSGAGGVSEAYWQVIECTDCNVQKIATNITNGATTVTETFTAVNQSKTLLFTSQYLNGNVNADDLPRTEFNANNQITHTRTGNGTQIDLITYVVEFTDATTTVQHASFSSPISTATTQSTLGSSINELGSVVLSPGANGFQGSGGNNGDDNPESNWFTLDIVNSTTVEARRASNDFDADFTYQVAEFDIQAPQVWYVFVDGDWSDPNTWTLDASTAPILNNPSNEIPGAGDQVIIYSGKEVNVDLNDIEINFIEVKGRLNLGNSSGHNFNSINGNGLITLEGNNPGSGLELNFPAGATNASIGFGDASNGGTLLIQGTGDLVVNQEYLTSNNRPLRNVRVNRQNSADKVVIAENIRLNGNLEINRGDVQINDGTNTTPLFIEVRNNITVAASGNMSVGTADAFTNLAGGTYGDYHRSYNTLQVGGNFVNNGIVRFTNQTYPTFNARSTDGAVSLVFNRSRDALLDARNTTDLYNLVLDKGVDQTYELNVNATARANFALFGPINGGNNNSGNAGHPEVQKSLYVANGTIRFTGDIFIPSVSEGGRDFEIGERAAFILDSPNVTFINTSSADDPVTEDPATWGLSFSASVAGTTAADRRNNIGINSGNAEQAFTIFGKLQVNDGLFYLGDGLSILFRDAAPGQIEVNGGELNTNQFALSVTATTGEYSVAINGGILRVTDDFPSRGSDEIFNLPLASTSFIMTGGEFIVEGNTGTGGINIGSSPSNINVSGGTVRVNNPGNNTTIESTAPFYDFIIETDDVTLRSDLTILNDLVLETGNVRSSGGNDFGSRLTTVTATDGSQTYDLTIGRNLTLNDQTVLDLWSNAPDNSNSSTVTFNGSNDAVLYVGDITTYDNSLVGYTDPEGENTFGRFELPFFNLEIEKNNATLFLQAKEPGDGGTPNGGDLSTFKTGTGGKNINNWGSNLVKVVNSFSLSEGAILNQVDPAESTIGYSLRLYGSEIFNAGEFFVYEDGITPKNGIIKLRKGGGDITLNSTSAAIFGNLRMNSGANRVITTSDVYMKRIEYRHGILDIDRFNLKVDVLDLNLETGDVQVVNGQEIFSAQDMIVMSGKKSDGGLSIKAPRSIDLGFPSYLNDNIEYNNANWLWFPVGTDAGGSDRYTPAICHLHTSGTIDGDEYINVTIVAQELATVDRTNNGDRIDYFWNVDYEGWDKGSAAAADRPTVSWLFQYDETDIVGSESNIIPGKVEDGVDEDGDGETFTRKTDGNGNTVRTGGDAGNQGDVLGNDPRNIIVFTNNGNPNIRNNNGRIFDQGGITGNWSGDWPGVGFPLSNENYTSARQNAFSGTPTIYYNRVSNGFSGNPGGLPQWNDNNTWSTSGHEGGSTGGPSAYPQAGDIAVIRTRANGALVNIGITNYSGDAGIDVEVAQLIFTREDELGNNRNGNRIFIDDDANVDFGIVEGNATFQLGLSVGNTPVLNDTDFGDFVNNYSDGSQFLFYGFSDGDLNLPTELNRYPNIRFEGNNNAAIDRFFSFAEDSEVLGELVVDSRATFNVNRNINIGGDLRLAAFRQGFMQFSGDNGAVSLNVAGRLRLITDDGNNDNRVFIDDSGTGLIHKFSISGDIELDVASQFDLFTNLSGGDNVQLELSPGAAVSSIWSNSSGLIPELYQVSMNGALDSDFSINSDFTIPDAISTFQPLEIVNGTLILNNADIDVLAANGSNFELPNLSNPEASSGSGNLEIAQGTVRIEGDDTGIILDGILTISGGTLDMNDGEVANNGNNFIQYGASGNATIELTNGNLLVGSQLRRSLTSVEGVLNYVQSGGIAQFGLNEVTEPSRGVFEVLNASSNFELTGGDFEIVQDNNSPSVASLRLTPASHIIAEGQVIRVGNVETPVGQNNFGVQSNIKIENLTIGNTNNPTIKIYSLPLEVDELVIGDGGNGTLDANGFNLTVNERFQNNGEFVSSGDAFNEQTTFFPSETASLIEGVGNSNFYIFEKSGNGTLSIEKDVTVTGQSRILDGTINTHNNAFFAEGDVLHDAIHTSDLEADATQITGFIFSGNQKQLLDRSAAGESTFGMLRIQNASGVELVNSEENFRITEKLTLASGRIDIGGNLLVFPVGAYIENGLGGRSISDFNVNNMILTNSSIKDFGVRKFYNTAVDGLSTFIYPVGLSSYTPVEFNRNTSNINGFITIRPVSDIAPIAEDSENDGVTCDDGIEITDAENVLQYHWIVRSQDITGLQGGFKMYYDQDDVAANSGYDETNYGAARLYDSDNFWDKNNEMASVEESNNLINFDFSNNDDATISGIYTAGVIQDGAGNPLCGAIPDQVPQFETLTSGQNLYDIGTSYVGGSAPPASTAVDVIVRSGFTLQLNQNNIRTRKIMIESGAILEIQSGVQNTNLGFVEGEGTLKLTVDAGEPLSFPAGDYSEFFPDVNCSTGGGLEFAGNGTYNIPAGIPNLRRLVFSGSGTRTFPNANSIKICEDLVFNDNVNVVVPDNSNSLVVLGNVIKSDNASFDAGGGNSRLVMEGSSQQEIVGEFTGANALNELVINNPAGLTIINTAQAGIAAGGNVEIKNNLQLTNGIINTDLDNSLKLLNGAVVSSGTQSSHVNGPLIRNLNSIGSTDAVFPVGDGGRFGRFALRNTANATDWTVTFFSESPETVAGTLLDNIPGDNSVVSKNQYWEATSPISNSGRVRIYWDPSSNIADGVADVNTSLSELRVVSFKSGDSQWTDLEGGASATGDENFGNLLSAATATFSTTYFTFGAGDAANNSLPVEMVFFRAANMLNRVELEWQTATEINNDFFEVQRSFDGKEFEVIGLVEGNGNSMESIDYNFKDYAPLAGESYYRLRQVDYDGAFEFSEVLTVKRQQDSDLVAVPNPTKSHNINLRLSGFHAQQKVQVTIFDLQGRRHYQAIHNPADFNKALPIHQNLNSGIYIVDVKQGNISKKVRLMVR